MSGLTWKHTIMYTNRCLFKIGLRLFAYHAFKIDRNPIWTAGVICLEEYSAIHTTAAIHPKKNHLLTRQRFSTQNLTLFSLSNSRDFTYSKGKNPIRNLQLFLFRLKNFPVHIKLAKLQVTSCVGIGHYRNVRGLGKSMVVFRLFEKLRYSNERSTIF